MISKQDVEFLEKVNKKCKEMGECDGRLNPKCPYCMTPHDGAYFLCIFATPPKWWHLYIDELKLFS